MFLFLVRLGPSCCEFKRHSSKHNKSSSFTQLVVQPQLIITIIKENQIKRRVLKTWEPGPGSSRSLNLSVYLRQKQNWQFFYIICLPIRATVAQVVEQAFYGYKTFHPKLCVCDDCIVVRSTATLPQSAVVK